MTHLERVQSLIKQRRHLPKWPQCDFCISVFISRLFLVAKCASTILELNWYDRFGNGAKNLTNWRKVLTRRPHSFKTDHLTSLIARVRLWNIQKWKTLVQRVQKPLFFKYANLWCFGSSRKLIAPKFYLSNFQVSCFFLNLRHLKEDNTKYCSARI